MIKTKKKINYRKNWIKKKLLIKRINKRFKNLNKNQIKSIKISKKKLNKIKRINLMIKKYKIWISNKNRNKLKMNKIRRYKSKFKINNNNKKLKMIS